MRVIDAAIEDFHRAHKRPRVWSLVVTLFGDAIVPRGGTFRLAGMEAIFDELRIESNALRTAVSRLTRDRWLTRERIGRASYYTLTADAQAKVQAASSSIYITNPSAPTGSWEIVLSCGSGVASDLDTTLRDLGFGSPIPRLYLRPLGSGDSKAPLPPGVLQLTGEVGALHDNAALLQMVYSSEQAKPLYAEFIEQFGQLGRYADELRGLQPVTAIALRLLIIHQWRRAVLRDHPLPIVIGPAEWPGHCALVLVRTLYSALLQPSEAWLDNCDGAPQGALPEPDPGLYTRFLAHPDA